jgi:DNA gyrase inhibitor GyrI
VFSLQHKKKLAQRARYATLVFSIREQILKVTWRIFFKEVKKEGKKPATVMNSA